MQVYDNKLHIYYNMKLITVHNIISNSKGQLIYIEQHYGQMLKKSGRFNYKNIEKIAQDNLIKIGEKYNDTI